MRAVLYLRVSTDDQQSPADSFAWQRARATELVARLGGVVVDEVGDVGVSRSIPWKRRPGASALLDRVRQGHPDFDVIVSAEVARSFGAIRARVCSAFA